MTSNYAYYIHSTVFFQSSGTSNQKAGIKQGKYFFVVGHSLKIYGIISLLSLIFILGIWYISLNQPSKYLLIGPPPPCGQPNSLLSPTLQWHHQVISVTLIPNSVRDLIKSETFSLMVIQSIYPHPTGCIL